jgi:CHAD domain-containing protein
MLDSQADLRPADDPMVTAVREAGREPGVEPGPSPLVLEPSMPAHVALATVFGHLLEALVAYEDGVQHRIDPEFLHHFRITVRRTRSAVRLAKKHLPRETTETWEPEWDWLAGITSAPRDLDVLLDEIASVRSTIEGELNGAGDAKIGLDELAEHVEMKRAKAQRKLERALAGDRYGTLKRGWRVAVDELRRPAGTAAFADDSTATALARELVRRAANQLVRHARDITSDSPATAIHDLRKRTKRMQDDLGEFQDNDVHHRLVSGLLESSSPLSPEAVEIGHELISRFDKRHDEARARLAGEIERFGSAMASVEL